MTCHPSSDRRGAIRPTPRRSTHPYNVNVLHCKRNPARSSCRVFQIPHLYYLCSIGVFVVSPEGKSLGTTIPGNKCRRIRSVSGRSCYNKYQQVRSHTDSMTKRRPTIPLPSRISLRVKRNSTATRSSGSRGQYERGHGLSVSQSRAECQKQNESLHGQSFREPILCASKPV